MEDGTYNTALRAPQEATRKRRARICCSGSFLGH